MVLLDWSVEARQLRQQHPKQRVKSEHKRVQNVSGAPSLFT